MLNQHIVVSPRIHHHLKIFKVHSPVPLRPRCLRGPALRLTQFLILMLANHLGCRLQTLLLRQCHRLILRALRAHDSNLILSEQNARDVLQSEVAVLVNVEDLKQRLQSVLVRITVARTAHEGGHRGAEVIVCDDLLVVEVEFAENVLLEFAVRVNNHSKHRQCARQTRNVHRRVVGVGRGELSPDIVQPLEFFRALRRDLRRKRIALQLFEFVAFVGDFTLSLLHSQLEFAFMFGNLEVG